MLYINIFLMLFTDIFRIMYVSLLLLYVILDIATSTQTDEQPYCSLRYRRLCQGKGRHVACQFPVPGPGMSCQNYTQIKFTNELRHFITHYINRRRQRVASGSERVRGGAHLPRPEIMMLVAIRYPYAGQSVGEVRWRSSDELSTQRAVRRVLDAWWGERRRVQARQLTMPFRLTAKGTVWGHFSQLAVWSLRAIGCAAVTHGEDYTRLLLVCDFSHTNMLGQKTISPGPMAPCPMHTVRKSRTAYPLLCAPVKRPIPEETKDPDEDNYDEENEDEEDDEQEETTAKATHIPSSPETVEKYTRTIVKESTKKYIPGRNTVIGFLVMKKDKITTHRLRDMFEQDLEQKSEERQAITLRKYHQWQSRSPYSEASREDQEQEDRILLRGQNEMMRLNFEDDATTPKYYKHVITQTEDIFSQAALRHRWKQTRIRPQRPGANALLSKPPAKNLQKSSIASLMLDQEDVEQLFHDTGFNVNWRQQSLRQ